MIRRCGILVPLLVLALVGAACASSGSGGSGQSYGDPNVITAEQVRQARGNNAYEVVQEYRSRWLLTSGRGAVQVYLDEREYGSVQTLRQIAVTEIESIRYYPFNEAIGRFPRFSSGAGVIQVHTR